MKKLIDRIKQIPQNIKDRKQRKAMRKKLRKIKKRIFNRRTLTKIFMGFMAVALVASYVLPYVLREFS